MGAGREPVGHGKATGTSPRCPSLRQQNKICSRSTVALAEVTLQTCLPGLGRFNWGWEDLLAVQKHWGKEQRC